MAGDGRIGRTSLLRLVIRTLLAIAFVHFNPKSLSSTLAWIPIHMRFISALAVAALLSSLAAGEPTVGPPSWTNIEGVLEGAITSRPINVTVPKPNVGFVEYLPKGYDPTSTQVRWPLVIYLAGIGEAGDGTDSPANNLYGKMVVHGPLYQANYFGWDFPAVVLAPQTSATWSSNATIKAIIDYGLANYRVDPDRVSVTGLCDGGSGAVRFAAAYPGYPASIMPIEATFPPSTAQSAALARVPMWAVHCFADPGISRGHSINWVNGTTASQYGVPSDCMATYPGYGSNRNHVAADSDASGAPLDSNGPVYTIWNCSATNGSKTISFPSAVGSHMSAMWSGTAARPYARASIGGATYVVSVSSTVQLTLLQPFTGTTGQHRLDIQTPVGYLMTANRSAGSGTWDWQRGQLWDKTRPSNRIFTMFWQQAHGIGWQSTWANRDCWDWTFSQIRVSTPIGPSVAKGPAGKTIEPGQAVTFAVIAAGTSPLSYAWLRNGVSIPGATNATLTIPSAIAGDSGTYTVQVSNAVGSVTSAGAVLSVTGPQVALNEFGDHQVIQRDIGGTSRQVVFTGTFTGSPHLIQVRLTQFTGNNVVVPWTTIATAPTLGSFSGTLIVPQGGWYRCEIQALNAGGTPIAAASTNRKWGVGVNILCIGQSNMYGYGSTTYTVADDRVGLLKPGAPWQVMADPWMGGKASPGPALGNTLVASLGIPVGLVPSAQFGTSMILSPNPNASWSYRNPSNPIDGSTAYGTSLSRALAAGGVEFIALSQGATEAVMATPPTVDEYVTAAQRMRANFASDLPAGGMVRWVHSQVGRSLVTGSYDLGYDRIREAHRLLDDGAGMLLSGSTMDAVIADGISHYDQAGQDAHGRRLARAILFQLGLRQNYGGPRIAGVQFADVGRTRIRVRIEHRGGSDLTPASAIPGFVVIDENGTKSTSVNRRSSDTVEITSATPCTGATYVTYLSGKNPAGPTGLLGDNQTDPEPVLPATMPLPVLETALPAITSSPLPRSVMTGDPVIFTVTASSALPLSYQWFRGNAVIDGATSSSLEFIATAADDGGSFSARAIDANGFAQSGSAVLTVTSPPLPFAPETSAYVGLVVASGGSLDDLEIRGVDKLVRGLIDAGLWGKFTRLNVFVGDATAARIPLIRTSGPAMDTWNGGVVYDRELGAALNGTNGFINTGATPLNLFPGNTNLHMGVLSTVGSAGGVNRDLIGGGTSTNKHSLRYIKGNILASQGGNGDCQPLTTGRFTNVPDGHFSLNVTAADRADSYLDGAVIASDTLFTPVAFHTQVITVGAYQSFGVTYGHASSVLAGYHFGSGLTQTQDAQVCAMLQTLLQDLGREQRVAAWGDDATALSSSDWFGRLMSLDLPFRTAYNGGVSGQTSAQVRARHLASPSHRGWNTLVWTGRTDMSTVNPDVDGLAANINAMVANLGHGRYRVLEILPRDEASEHLGGSGRARLDQTNDTLAATFGARFVRLLPHLQGAANGSAEDALDVVRGVVPRSLRVDTVNLTRGPGSGNAIVQQRVALSVLPGWDPPMPGGGG